MVINSFCRHNHPLRLMKTMCTMTKQSMTGRKVIANILPECANEQDKSHLSPQVAFFYS
jgi:hypothetical protein